MKRIPEVEGLTIRAAAVSYAEGTVELDLDFTDGTSYAFVVECDPTVTSSMYATDNKDDTQDDQPTVLHQPGKEDC